MLYLWHTDGNNFNNPSNSFYTRNNNRLNMFRLYPYKMGSASVKKLKSELNALIIKLENTRYRFNPNHIIINWGNSRRPAWMTEEIDDFVLNKPEAVAVAGNKLETLRKLTEDGVRTVPWTASQDVANWWLNEGEKVYSRHSLTGHSGEGIEVVTPQNVPENNELDEIAERLNEMSQHTLADVVRDAKDYSENIIPDAPLYTMGVRNSGEYRVHVFDGEVILYQKKSRRVDEETGEVVTAEGEQADVRNLASNWVYRTGNLRRLERVEELAQQAIEALGLDFGAVDIIMDENGDVYVLEVNTAPGLGNTDSLQAYADVINSLN